MTQAAQMTRAIALTSQPLPPLSRLALGLVLTLVTWDLRRRTRRDLSRLTPHLLHDVGIDGQSAAMETQKPFWRD